MATGQRGFDTDDFFDQRRIDFDQERRDADRQRREEDRARRDALRAQDEGRREEAEQLRLQRDRLDAMLTLVNDDDITLSAAEMEVINDKELRMMSNGEVVKRQAPGARDIIRRSGQFSRANILPNIPSSKKRARKKTKTDKNMSKALTEANEKLRTKKGKLRKGRSQSDVMTLAHKLLKKM